MKRTTVTFPDDFVKSIEAMNEMCSQYENIAAAMLYRLMFRKEFNISILDYYADKIIEDLSENKSEFAAEDYHNYLGYLRVVLPNEFYEHRKVLRDCIGE